MTRAEQAARMRLAKAARTNAIAVAIARPVAPAPVAPIAAIMAPASDSGTFDPGEWPVAEVLAYLDANPDDAARVLALESDGKGRKSILSRGL